MKSSTDIYHGDEHLTDKPEKFVVRMSEVVTYEVEVEAIDKEEAEDIAVSLISKDSSHTVNQIARSYVIDVSGFQTDRIDRVKNKQNYNYSYGGTE